MQIKKLGRWARKSVWTFPVALFAVVVILAALRVSGTSAGVYRASLNGPAKDPSLIFGKARTIRSDEWLVVTQLTVAQSRQGFPRINSHMGDGQDLSLQAEVPTKDWSTIFKPQNWSFFVLPLESAFAFRWWLLMYLLIVSCYFFVLRLMPGKKLFAILFSLAVGASPFELWWYQSTAFLSAAYSFMMAILAMRIIGNEPIRLIKNLPKSRMVQAAALGFIAACFGLILYPPFQIPVAVVLLFFGVGYLLHSRYGEKIEWSTLLKRSIWILASVIAAGAVLVLFLLTHNKAIAAVNNSVYPGHRVAESGDLKALNIFDSFVMPIEQGIYRSHYFFRNPSEASNFILLLPFLIVPGLMLQLYEWKKKRRPDWIFTSLQVLALLFFARAFLPYGSGLFKLLFLQKVPNKRLVIGIGFLGLLHMLYFIKKVRRAGISQPKLDKAAAIFSLITFLILIAVGWFIIGHYPKFLANPYVIIGLAGAFSAIVGAFVAGRLTLAAALLFLFTAVSSFRVLPIYKGLGELTHSRLVSRMESVSGPSDSWVTVGSDAMEYENFGLLAGRRSIGGTQVYPDKMVWSKLGNKYENIYNREGHAIFVDDAAMADPIRANTEDTFVVKFDCSPFVKANIQFALSIHPLALPCAKPIGTVSYPTTTFYLTRILP